MIFNAEFDFPVMGIPELLITIYLTSHTLGYDTALNTVVDVIDKIRDTASSHNRLFCRSNGRDGTYCAGIGAGAEKYLYQKKIWD
jgi:6-phosphofructokinase 1